MIISEDKSQGIYFIKAYSPGKITVNNTTFTMSLIITANTLVTDWPPQTLEQLQPSHFNPIITLNPEIILLGTGIKFKRPPANLLAPLYEHNLGVECMDTGAACRTFTALSAEKRNVVAALLIE